MLSVAATLQRTARSLPGSPRAALRYARSWPEAPALLVLVVGMLYVPQLFGKPSVPWYDVLLGASTGCPLALQALGILLVYRTNRIINFAQVMLGWIGGFMFVQLWQHQTLILLADRICNCMPSDYRYASYGMQLANFLVAMVLGLVAAPLMGYLAYVLIVRRFERTPPLVLTILTVALAMFISGIVTNIGSLLNNVNQGANAHGVVSGVNRLPPFDLILDTGGGPQLNMADLLGFVVVIALCGAMAFFLLRTALGVVLRASADDQNRTRTLGVNVVHVKALTWGFAGLLSGIAAVLWGWSGNVPAIDANGIGTNVMVQLLAIVVIARLRSLTLAVAAAIGLGIVHAAMTAVFSSESLFTGLLFPIIAGFLLLQRGRMSRAENELAGSWNAADEVRPIPRELLAVPSVRRWLRVIGLAVAVLLVGYPWVTDSGSVTFASELIVYGMIGLSLLILAGWAGQISLGQFAIAAMGAFTTTLLAGNVGLPWFIAVVIGALAGTVVAALVGIPALRLSGLYLAVTTLALSISVTSIFLDPTLLGSLLPDTLNRPTILGLDSTDNRVFYYLMLVVAAIVTAAVLRLRRSRAARALIASRDNAQLAQSFGINLFRARLQAFALSGFVAALAGGFFAFAQQGVHPPDYAASVSLILFLVTMIGGLGSVWGPLIGVTYYALVKQVPFVSGYSQFLISGGVVLLFLVFPSGIGGLIFKIRDAVLRRVAIRRRIVVPSLLADMRESEQNRRAAIAPKLSPSGLAAFIPTRFRLPRQWSIDPAAPAKEKV